MEMICEHRPAFSLRDEIGQCPNITIDIDVIDKSPFFVRPFPIMKKINLLWTGKWKDWYI